MTADRVFHDGNKTDSRKVVQVWEGMGGCGKDGLLVSVDAGSKGSVDDGVTSALRLVEMLSSIPARESLKKSLKTLVSKQNRGVSCVGETVVGRDMTSGCSCPEVRRGRGRCRSTEDDVRVESNCGVAQNHASLPVDSRLGECVNPPPEESWCK